MSDDFHDGEHAVQKRAGTWVEGAIRSTIPDVAAAFLLERSFIVVAGRDEAGVMWASMLTGTPGFLRAPDPQTMTVTARPVHGDPLTALFASGGPVGTIAMDHHRRMRVNGVLTPQAGGFTIVTEQVYSNCGRYISKRLPMPDAAPPTAPTVHVGSELTADQAATIRAANAFFIATSHPDGAADASHRGGNPGFVLVDTPHSCRWPDYNGNSMFMTLGNLALNSRVGLLFPDWDNGGLLHVSGRAHIVWDETAARALPGAERVVEMTIDAVREIRHANRLRWSDPVLSRFNPTAVGAH